MTIKARLPRRSVNACNGLNMTRQRSTVNETVNQALIELATDSTKV